MTNRKLSKDTFTKKQRAFIEKFIEHGNASRATKEAGYAPNGSSWSHASMGYDLLQNPKIIREIERIYMFEGMRAVETIYRLSIMARADPTDFLSMTEDGVLEVDPEKIMSSPRSFVIQDFKFNQTVGPDGTVTTKGEIKLHNSLSALDRVAKFHELFSNTISDDDWRIKAVSDIRRGLIKYGPLAEEFGQSLAEELFEDAGVPILLQSE
jgi:phage terminase small subunit